MSSGQEPSFRSRHQGHSDSNGFLTVGSVKQISGKIWQNTTESHLQRRTSPSQGSLGQVWPLLAFCFMVCQRRLHRAHCHQQVCGLSERLCDAGEVKARSQLLHENWCRQAGFNTGVSALCLQSQEPATVHCKGHTAFSGIRLRLNAKGQSFFSNSLVWRPPCRRLLL